MTRLNAAAGNKAQTILEFSAGMVVLCLIVYGMVGIFRWGMMDLAERRYDHDMLLKKSNITTEAQLNPRFHQQRPMDAVLYQRNAAANN